MKRVSQISAKVATQDLDGVLPVYHTFGNIMGGVFWHPVYNLLEEGRQILLVNPQHMRAVPGHKVRREVA